MPNRIYKKRRFGDDALAVIDRANAVCAQWQADGFDLTLRQVYYQFVAHDYFPDDRTWKWTGSKWVRDPNGTKNAEPNYKWLGDIINNARLAGYMDWDYIIDRTRDLEAQSHWASPGGIVRDAARAYNIAKWNDQPERLEVWVEKDALVGVLGKVCPQNDVDYFSCRGYTSQSEVWQAAQRLREYIVAGQSVTVLHLGDHDPSGIDMTRDIAERLWRFIAYDLMYVHDYDSDKAVSVTNAQFNVERIALNRDQIDEYDPPPNPAKLTDSRSTAYIRDYGDESWELDALPPSVIVDMIQGHIEDHRDDDLWQAACVREESEREILTATSQRWGDVSTFLNVTGGLSTVRAR